MTHKVTPYSTRVTENLATNVALFLAARKRYEVSKKKENIIYYTCIFQFLLLSSPMVYFVIFTHFDEDFHFPWYITKYTMDVENFSAILSGIFCDIPWVMKTFI